MTHTTIKLTFEAKERLRKYKNKVSNTKETDLTYCDAVIELLDRAELFTEYLRGT